MKLAYANLALVLAAGVALSQTATAQVTAQGPSKYELTITNGSQMPISPAAIYAKNGAEAAVHVGSAPTTGFIQLCQTGNPATRIGELQMDTAVKFITQTNSIIMPGESRMVEVEVMNPERQSVSLEVMYGKSKDTCGVSTVNSHSLVALKQHVTSEIIQKDNTLSTGAFSAPVLPTGMTYLEPTACPSAQSAIDCLRELAAPNTAKAQVHFFSGYFPSLVTALEMKYGAADVQTLLFPTSGAIELKLKLKH